MSFKMAVISSLILINGSVFAHDIALEGTQTHTIHAQANQKIQQSAEKTIKFLKVKLSPSALQALKNKSEFILANLNTYTKAPNLPSKVDLGMNGVPVLNQGSHGSCVTFAATGAFDALLKSDYVSQLCQLQLGNYLEKNSYGSSGWNGSFGRMVLSQMETFGIVNKTQEAQGCGGLTQYPLEGKDPQTFINVEDYHNLSESLDDHLLTWSSILDIADAIERMDTNKTLNSVKTSLSKGDRVIFATLLVDLDSGVAGAVGTKNQEDDTWVLTTAIARDAWASPVFAGHEMIITGYDDDAIAKDEDGYTHKGLLTLRNSWGDNAGDKGNFYMSYDYFKLFVVEADRIQPVPLGPEEDQVH